MPPIGDLSFSLFLFLFLHPQVAVPIHNLCCLNRGAAQDGSQADLRVLKSARIVALEFGCSWDWRRDDCIMHTGRCGQAPFLFILELQKESG